MKKILAAFLLMGTLTTIQAQQHPYIPPDDLLVIKKLEQWQDLKFGLMMHWGTYSEWGIVESWSLCPEDEGWCKRTGPYANDWFAYKKAYENLQSTFNPIKFDPSKFATAAKDAGMKYLVFTTKHHDGFCMFETKTTDYKVTDAKTAFSSNPKSNIAREIFDVFRKNDFMIGAYFSKPDWHAPDYWWSYFPPKDRNVSYDPKRYPDKWNSFKQFTYTQISELMQNYGRMDILWLDGGWVRPFITIDTSVSWQRSIPYDQDIDIPNIAKMARSYQPGLLMVDRTVTGKYENYVTPEQQIPEKPLGVPWETCMTMGNSWSYVNKENYKPARTIVHLLCDIVAKGGSLLLNVAPGPDGEWHEEAYQRLKEIGAWMKVNGDAIYATRNIMPYRKNKWAFTSKQNKEYAIYLSAENESMPAFIEIPSVVPKPSSKIYLLGYEKPLQWSLINGSIRITIPATLIAHPPSLYAWAFQMEIK